MADTQSSTHTPGPWEAEISPRENNVYASIRAKDGPCVGVAYFRDGDGWGGPSREEMEDNARLMAAGPELLETLKYWLEYVETSALAEIQALKGWQGKARAAIEKVEK